MPDGEQGPKPARDITGLWGRDGPGEIKLLQVKLANTLLQVALTFFAELLGAGGLIALEHLAHAWCVPQLAGIWTMQQMRWLKSSVAVKVTTFKQGWHGQYMVKPTSIMALWFPQLAETSHSANCGS